MEVKSKIKDKLKQVSDIYSEIKDMIPQPVKNFSSKGKIVGDFVKQKLIILAIILDPDIKEKTKSPKALVKELLHLSKEDLVSRINSYELKHKKTLIATYLVVLDIFYGVILIHLLLKIVPDQLGYITYTLVEKTIQLIKKDEQPEQTDKLLEKISKEIKKKITNTFNKIKEIIPIPNIVTDKQLQQESLEKQRKIYIGKLLFVIGLTTAVLEESSKTIADLLKVQKQYMIIFNAVETVGYIYKFNQSLKSRIKTIFLHIGLQLMHKVPKLRKYTYIIHMVYNIVIGYLAFNKHQK